MRSWPALPALVAAMLGLALARDPDRDVYLEPLVDAQTANGPPVKPSWSADEFHAHMVGEGGPYRSGDHLAYLATAQRLARGERISADFAELWPPGVSLVAAGVLTLTGGARYGQSMAVATALLMGLAMGLLVLATGAEGRRAALLSAGLLSLWLWPGGGEFLFGMGSVLSEGVSHAFLLMGLAGVVGVLRSSHLGWAALAGVGLGGAALSRIFFVGLYPVLIVLPGLVLVALAIQAARRRAWPDPRRGALRVALLLLMAGVTGHLIFQPWRNQKKHIYKHERLIQADAKYTWKWAFAADADIPWYHQSGNAACHADPELCRYVQTHWDELAAAEIPRLALRTLLHHPLRWLAFKIEHLNWLWMGRSWQDLLHAHVALFVEGLVQAALGLVGLVGLAWAALRRRRPEARWGLALATAFVGLYAATFLILQYEWRYALGLRMFCYALPLVLWAWRPSASDAQA